MKEVKKPLSFASLYSSPLSSELRGIDNWSGAALKSLDKQFNHHFSLFQLLQLLQLFKCLPYVGFHFVSLQKVCY